MYCPVDGTEWRESITRCPEHDVDLVDEPPEVPARPSASGWLRGDAFAGTAAIVVAVAGIVYAVAGVALSALTILADAQDSPAPATTKLDVVQFLQASAWSVGLGALGCLGAAVLARVYLRLRGRQPEAEDGEDAPPPPGAWFMPLLSTLTVSFAAVWVAISLWIAWETAASPSIDPFGFTPVRNEGDLLAKLFAFQGAALACLAGSIAAMGALLMARAHDRLSGIA